MRPRDSQRQKLYDAERAAFGPTKTLSTVAEVQAYADKVTGSKWWASQPRLSTRTITVSDGRGSGNARAVSSYRIQMPTHMRSEWVTLHEIAHCAMGQRHGWDGVAAHGWQFAEFYLALVRRFLGVAAHDQLRDAFKAKRVKYRPPRTSPAPALTDEQRAANIDRLAAAREKQAAARAARVAADPIAVHHGPATKFTGVSYVRIEVRDLTADELIRDGLAQRVERDDGTWWTAGDGFTATTAREYAITFGREHAAERPGHLIETRLIGKPRRLSSPDYEPEVARFQTKPVSDEPRPWWFHGSLSE